jgi:cytochrome b561
MRSTTPDHDSAPSGYSNLQIALHWTIAALVIFQLFVNTGMQDAFDDRLDQRSTDQMGAAILHIAVGVTVLLLAVVRVFVRFTRGVPPAHGDNPAIVNWIGYATHLLLYGFIFFMPLTGAVAWFGGVELSAQLHELGRLILVPAIGMHALGGLAEHFVFRNNSLQRMLGFELPRP